MKISRIEIEATGSDDDSKYAAVINGTLVLNPNGTAVFETVYEAIAAARDEASKLEAYQPDDLPRARDGFTKWRLDKETDGESA